MNTIEMMPLSKALYILSACHTRDDDLTGFVVESTPMLSPAGEFSRAEYIEAWRSVRYNIGLQANWPGWMESEKQDKRNA